MTEHENPVKTTPWRRRLLWAVLIIFALVAGVWVLAANSIGRTIYLNPWLRGQMVTQVSAAIPGGEVAFEAVSVRVDEDLHPTVVFERLDLVPENGGPVVSFSEVQTSLSYRRLLRGQVAPRNIYVSGVTLAASRAAEGEVAVAFGETQADAPVEDEALSLSDIETEIDRLFTESQFEQLTRLQIDAITIQFDDRRAGRSWTVDGGQFLLDRAGDDLRMSTNIALLGGRDYVSSVEFSYESQIGARAATFGASFEDLPSADIASQSPALTWLEIIDAPISGAIRFEIDESGDLGPLNATLQIHEGVLQPGGEVRPVPFQSARSYFTFDPTTFSLSFDELSLESAWGEARASGVAHLKDVQGGMPNELWGQLEFSKLSGNPAGLFADEVGIDYARGDLRLRLDPFEVDIGEFLVRREAQRAVASGRIGTAGDNWDISLNAHMDAIAAQDVVSWWPENAKPKTRSWLADNITSGDLSDINFALRSQPGGKPDIYLDFDFENADVRYAKTLPLIKYGRGQAVWVDHRFVVMAAEGQVTSGAGGNLQIAGSSFVIPDTQIKEPPAEINIKVAGTVTSALAYLDHPPMEVLSRSGQPVDLAEGDAEISGVITLPLRKALQAEEVDFNIQAALRDVRSERLLPGKVISAPSLTVQATAEAVSISGDGRIGAVPISARWTTELGPKADGQSRLSGVVELSERTVDEFNLGLGADMFTGRGEGQFEVRFAKDKPPVLNLRSDTQGIRLAVPAISWRKSAERGADFSLTAELAQPVKVTEMRLEAAGLSAVADISLRSDGGLSRMRFSDLKISNWFDGVADLIGRVGTPVPAVEIKGGVLDLRRLPDGGNGGGSGGSSPIAAKLDRVIVGEELSMSNVMGTFETRGGFAGNFNALVSGAAPIFGSIAPYEGRSAVRITASDAGRVLKAAGLIEQASGGTLDLSLTPMGAEDFNGQAEIKNVRIQDAPAIAELLNAISVVGLLDQLSGDGILFTDVESAFRLSPNGVDIRQASAVGPSMGISANGVYRQQEKIFDLQGVISPIYVLNAIGRPIARKGEGLFGFNYSVQGTSDDLRVSVNPLSVLTPGIFREIFRRPPPNLQGSGQE